ncbi:small multidrug Resistance domain containing protein [Nitzschia inconspicua]|uniref:Small multidrug Resistance domain containing protein n=1 Tax=Nitzschia inconspicua TaxID=303405 RepID=A0A9K3KXW7_9STRA|nr:small multidrug Resistance domain containing protein [Nitzschia inconspicua]
MIERQGGVVFRQFRGGGGGGTIRDASLPRPKNVLVSLVVTLQSRILDLNRFVGNDPKRCWTVLLAAIVLDTVSTVTMKRAQQKQSLALLLSAYTGYFLSLSSLVMAIQAIDIGVAYAVWAALGTAVVSTVGIIWFGERNDATKILCLSMIVLGVVGLEMSSS